MSKIPIYFNSNQEFQPFPSHIKPSLPRISHTLCNLQRTSILIDDETEKTDEIRRNPSPTHEPTLKTRLTFYFGEIETPMGTIRYTE